MDHELKLGAIVDSRPVLVEQGYNARVAEVRSALEGRVAGVVDVVHVPPLRSEVNSELNFPPNFEGLVLGCIDADFCK